MKRLNVLDWFMFALLIVGGLNWGLVGLFDYNLVEAIFGSVAGLANVIYIIVGLSALYSIYALIKVETHVQQAATREEPLRRAG